MHIPRVAGVLVVTAIMMLEVVEGANIMFFLGVSSYSHRSGMWPLAEKLAERGHSITFVSPYEAKKPNPKIIDYVPPSLKRWVDSWNETDAFYNLRVNGELDYEWFKLGSYGIGLCDVLLGDPDYVGWLDKTKFDLIFVDALANECAYGMAYKQKSKMIVYNTADGFPWLMDPFGIPDESSWIPDMVFHYPLDMNFFQRLKSALMPVYFRYHRAKSLSQIEVTIRDKLNLPEMPSLAEIERDHVSLLFVNQHFAEDFARPYPPNVIPLGGLQCSESLESIPKEMEAFINKGSKMGFIYVSFGSYVEFSKFPEDKREVFINTFKTFSNVQFIWKLDTEKPKDLPANVFPVKWVNQQALLAHPKIKAFITHGGLFGIQEGICYAVPLIAFPIFAEQDYNAVKIETREIGVALEISKVTEDQFEKAVRKILQNEKFSKNMKRVSTAFRDRPSSPLDTAVWWTEYVLRHEDTRLLKPTSMYQSWWKRRLLDVWAVLFAISFAVIFLFIVVLKIAYSYLFGVKTPKQKLKSS